MDLPKDIKAIVAEYLTVSLEQVKKNKKQMNVEFGMVKCNYIDGFQENEELLDTQGAKDFLLQARCYECKKYMHLRFEDNLCNDCLMR